MNSNNPKYPIEVVGDITLTQAFWDCECDTNYIHPCYIEHCELCSTPKDDQPDSRVKEVIHYNLANKEDFETDG